jgi:hypothetical protein
MTKANLIDEVARTTERTKKEAEQIVDAVLEAIAGAIERVKRLISGASAVSGEWQKGAAGAQSKNWRSNYDFSPERSSV